MQLHADLTKPAIVRGKDVVAVSSPAHGVVRRMLDRDGGEVCHVLIIRGADPEV